MPSWGRSSSASHFSKDHETATAGMAAQDFYGITLSNNLIDDAPAWQLVTLLTVVFVVPLMIVPLYCQGFNLLPQDQAKLGTIVAFVSGTALLGLGALWVMPESTVIPLLSTVIYTRTAYPYPIVMGHCISAAASYRKNHERGHRKQQVPYLQSLLGAFFLYGFGGSIVSDLLMGLPVTALSHPRIVPCFLLGWTLVWWSPGNVVYQYICGGGSNTSSTTTTVSSKSLVYYLLVACEAVDAVTTPMGRISRSARELRNKTTAPIVAGLLAGIGGAGLRFLAGEPGVPSKLQVALEAGFWKTLCYSLLWWSLAVLPCLPVSETSRAITSFFPFNWLFGPLDDRWNSGEEQQWNHCDAYNGSDLLRVMIVTGHTAWTLLVEFGLVQGHPFVWLSRNIFPRGMNILTHIRPFGVQGQEIANSEPNENEYTDAAHASNKKKVV